MSYICKASLTCFLFGAPYVQKNVANKVVYPINQTRDHIISIKSSLQIMHKNLCRVCLFHRMVHTESNTRKQNSDY